MPTRLSASLKEKAMAQHYPRYTGNADQIDKSIKRGIRCCNIMLLLQKITSVDVIEDFLADIVTQSDQRESELPLLICSDHEAEAIQLKPPNTRILQCKGQFDQQFLAEVDA